MTKLNFPSVPQQWCVCICSDSVLYQASLLRTNLTTGKQPHSFFAFLVSLASFLLPFELSPRLRLRLLLRDSEDEEPEPDEDPSLLPLLLEPLPREPEDERDEPLLEDESLSLPLPDEDDEDDDEEDELDGDLRRFFLSFLAEATFFRADAAAVSLGGTGGKSSHHARASFGCFNCTNSPRKACA